ncbi:MAG: hypothetical protein ACK4GK_18095, partial [Ferrovibrio sp.]
MQQPGIADLIQTIAANHGLPELAMTKTAPAKSLKHKKVRDGEEGNTHAAPDNLQDGAQTDAAQPSGDAPMQLALNEARLTASDLPMQLAQAESAAAAGAIESGAGAAAGVGAGSAGTTAAGAAAGAGAGAGIAGATAGAAAAAGAVGGISMGTLLAGGLAVAGIAAAAGGGGSSSSNATTPTDTTAPTVQSIAITSATGIQNGTLNAGDVVSVTVTMSEATTVTGTPQLALNIGGVTVQANYQSGSGTNKLVFTYTIQPGQTDIDGISIDANALKLNGGTLKDAAGNDAVLTHSAVADNAGYKVDTTAPTQTVGGVDISADTGMSATDFITNTAAQTITGTLSAALGTGDKLYGSVDNGTTWTDITSKVTGTNISWAGATLSGSTNILFTVTAAAGNDSATSGSQAYVL